MMPTIRPMTIEDLPGIDQVQRASFAPAFWEDMSMFKEIIEHAPSFCVLAENKGEVLGYVLAYPSLLERDDFENGWRDLTGDETYIYVHDLSITPNGRGQGLARQLFNALDFAAKDNGFTNFAGIAVQESKGFWEKLGFEVSAARLYHGQPGNLMIKHAYK